MIIMAYIRDRSEERTGYQISGFPPDSVDNHCDFVMVYGLNETTLERINVFRARGYIIHLMTGIAWGGYLDYLSGNMTAHRIGTNRRRTASATSLLTV